MAPCQAALLLAAAPLLALALALDISQCIAPLGMESGQIPDRDLSASSSFDDGNVGPQNGRLNQELAGGAWCPKEQVTTETREWLQVELPGVHVVTAVGTQGRFGNGQGQEYAEAYVLEYWRPRLGKWLRYRSADGQEILAGNTNTYLEKKVRLEPPVWASRLRFLPYSSHRRTVCMRVELYGCYWSVGIVSYSMPKGNARSNGVELSDVTYDGAWGAELRGGLGQLVDGRFGGDDIREAARPSAWVGWRNDSRAGRPPAVTFEFDRVREFSALHVYCNNRFMRDVQVFSEAVISFSVGGQHFQEEPIRYVHEPDHIFESSRNVSIKLHHRIGKWVRVELHFAARWILVSEFVFDSDVAQGNYSAERLKPGGRARVHGGAGGPAVHGHRGGRADGARHPAGRGRVPGGAPAPAPQVLRVAAGQGGGRGAGRQRAARARRRRVRRVRAARQDGARVRARPQGGRLPGAVPAAQVRALLHVQRRAARDEGVRARVAARAVGQLQLRVRGAGAELGAAAGAPPRRRRAGRHAAPHLRLAAARPSRAPRRAQVTVAAVGGVGAAAAAGDHGRGGVPAPPPAHDLQAGRGRVRHGVRGGGGRRAGVRRRRDGGEAAGGRQVPVRRRHARREGGVRARRARPGGAVVPAAGARGGAVPRAAAGRGAGVPGRRPVRLPARRAAAPPARAAARRRAARRRHALPRVAQLRAQGPRRQERVNRQGVPGEDQRLRHGQRGVRGRLLQGGGAHPAAAALGRVGGGAGRPLLHAQRRLGLRRHAARDLHALPAPPLRPPQRRRGVGEPVAPAGGRRHVRVHGSRAGRAARAARRHARVLAPRRAAAAQLRAAARAAAAPPRRAAHVTRAARRRRPRRPHRPPRPHSPPHPAHHVLTARGSS